MAARAKTLLLLLAAVCLPAFAHVPHSSVLVQKPHQGVERFAQPSHRGPGDANALTAPGLPGCLYDKGRRSRSTAKERDAESGLDYFLARYYSGALGRFTSVDPENAGALGEDPQSWNGYAYVTNRPLTLTDPDGRCPWCVGALIGGAAGGLINAGLQLAFTGEIKGNQVLASAAAGFAAGATLGVLAPAATTTILSVTGVEATIGASGTAGAIALGVTPAAASGVVGGITGRAIEAGGSLSQRLNAATANPTEIVKDAATGVVINGVVGAAEAGVQAGRTAGATQNLERQVAARTRPGAPANSPRVTNQRIQQLRDSQQKLSGQQETAGRVASAGATLIVEDEKMRDQLGVGR